VDAEKPSALDAVLVRAGHLTVDNGAPGEPEFETDTVEAATAELSALRRVVADNARMREALERIAAWDEGPVITGSFDEPGSAIIARAALGGRDD